MTIDDIIETMQYLKEEVGGEHVVTVKANKKGIVRITDIIAISHSKFEGVNIVIDPIYD